MKFVNSKTKNCRNDDWCVVSNDKKRKVIRKTFNEGRKTVDPKTLAKYSRIPCRNQPECKWESSCWFMHDSKEKRQIEIHCKTTKDIFKHQLDRSNCKKKNENDLVVINFTPQIALGCIKTRPKRRKSFKNNENTKTKEQEKLDISNCKKEKQNYLVMVNSKPQIPLGCVGTRVKCTNSFKKMKTHKKKLEKIEVIEKRYKYELTYNMMKLPIDSKRKDISKTKADINESRLRKSNFNCKFFKNRKCFNIRCKPQDKPVQTKAFDSMQIIKYKEQICKRLRFSNIVKCAESVDLLISKLNNKYSVESTDELMNVSVEKGNKEIKTEETMKDFSDLSGVSSVGDVFQNLFKNPGKLMNMVKQILFLYHQLLH